jgi:branched-chain amino acid transport system substrate-binding protein
MIIRHHGIATVSVVLLIVGLLVGAAVVYALQLGTAPGGGTTSTKTTTIGGGATITTTLATTIISTVSGGGLTGTVNIGNLVEQTGDYAADGQATLVGEQMALADVNSWLSASGSSLRFALVTEDTTSDPTVALTKLQTLAAQGIQVVVGPDTSGQSRNILGYANQHHIVLISPASTAPDLAIANDYLFRAVPNDLVAAGSLSRAANQSGYNHLVILFRNDAFGQGLASSIVQVFTGFGGTVDQVSFTPLTTGSYDFSAQLSQMQSDYQAATGQGKTVAVMAIGFDEIAFALQQASSYPQLLQTDWFYNQQGDTLVVQTAGSAAVQVKMISTTPTPTSSPKFEAFSQLYHTQTGKAPGGFNAIPGYDSLWLAVLSILACGAENGVCVQHTLPSVANNYFGVSGWMQLNAAGDRSASDYAVWEVASVSGTPTWVSIGTWSFAQDHITYTSGP